MKVIFFDKIRFAVLFIGLLTVFSCAKENEPLPEEYKKNKLVNDWIQENMEVVYFWNTKIPTKQDKTLYPADYYESILYRQEDHFSFIAEDYAKLRDELNGVVLEAGYHFSLFRKDAVAPDIFGMIDYVKPNSPASSTDLKRGDYFLTINGKQINIDNYKKLVEELSSPHVLGVYREGYIQPISFSVTQYEENPVFLDSIYEIGGKKIAYLIYNFFALDRGDGSYAYLKELNDIFGRFKEVNPDELVLDLRYNTGGVVTAAVSLSSMISGRNSSDLFSISKYNSIVDKEFKKIYGDDYNKTFFDDFLIIRNEEDKIIDQSIPINKLSGLKRLYVLTSQSTASASELVINGLRPYMNVVLVGKTTRGKNTGMWFIYEDDPVKQKDNRWGLLPIVVKTYNSKNEGDFTNGIKADMEVNEYSADLFQLGDTRELLLGAALIDIGVRNASGLRRAEERFSDKPLISTGDLMQARGNLIVERF